MYLRISWIGKPSTNLEKKVKTAMESCYGSVSTRLILTSKRMLPVACKDVLPTIQKSFVKYEYKCHCDSRYIGRTSKDYRMTSSNMFCNGQDNWLVHADLNHTDRANETTPNWTVTLPLVSNFLLENEECALNHDNKRFSILAIARSSFHHNLLEAAYIKTQRPVLC